MKIQLTKDLENFDYCPNNDYKNRFKRILSNYISLENNQINREKFAEAIKQLINETSADLKWIMINGELLDLRDVDIQFDITKESYHEMVIMPLNIDTMKIFKFLNY